VGDRELTCREVVELISDYLDGALPPKERLRLEQHLDDCPHCVIYLEQVRQTVRALGRVSDEELDAAVRNDLIRAFREWPRAGTG
jgi:anti-sigma factor RsiW